MRFPILSMVQFHARRAVRTDPRLGFGVAISLITILFALASYIRGTQALSDAVIERNELSAIAVARSPVTEQHNAEPALRPFDSAGFVQELNNAADATDMPLGEITFALEDSPPQPYLRYRATLTATSNYLAIRRFVTAMHSNLADVSLDSLSCTRKDIKDAALSCDLAFSAFYRKAGND